MRKTHTKTPRKVALYGPERYPTAVVKLAKRHARKGLSLRKVSEKLAEAGHLNVNGQPFAAQSVKNMVR